MTEQTSPLPAPDGTVETAAMRLANLSGDVLGENVDPEYGTPHQQERPRDDQGRFKQRDGDGVEPQSDAEAAPSDDDTQDEAQEAQPGDDEEQYVEIPGEEGQEPTKLALSELVKAHQELASLNAGKAEILQRVEQEAVKAQSERIGALDNYLRQTAQQMQTFLQLAAIDFAPDVELLNPNNPNYNPDEYHRQVYEAQGLQRRINEVRQGLEKAEGQRKALEEHQKAERINAEWAKLEAARPELRDPAKADAWVTGLRGDLAKYYGMDAEALKELVVDHKFFLAAEDAVKFRKAQEKAPEVKKAIEAKPKLVNGRPPVPAKQREAKAGNDAREALKKTGKVEAAAKLFERFA